MVIGTHIPPIPLESDIDFKNDMIMEYMKSNLNYLGTLCVGTKLMEEFMGCRWFSALVLVHRIYR